MRWASILVMLAAITAAEARWGGCSSAAVAVVACPCGKEACDCGGTCQCYEWKTTTIEGGEGRLLLWRGGKLLGFWDVEQAYYRPWLGGENWGERGNPPHPAPVGREPNFGVDREKVAPVSRVTLNGREITRDKAIQVIEQSKIPDDSKKFRLVVIGAEADRKRVTDAWASVEPAVKDRFAVWSVPPDHWSLKDGETGEPVFKATGSPTVYCQAPGGKSLHRQDDFTGPQDFEAIRKAVKKYDAAADPDLRKPAPKTPAVDPSESPLPVVPTCCVVAAIAAAYYFRKDK